MPHHGVMALSAPDLLAAYDVVYKVTKLDHAVLTPLEKNFIWILIVAVQQIPLGGHHVKDFVTAGGTIRQVETAAALAGFLIGARGLRTIATSWQDAAPGVQFDAAYRRTIEAINGAADKPLPKGLLELALAAAQSCRQDWNRVADHLRAAKEVLVPDNAIAAALSVLLLPCGSPVFVQACTVWRDLVRSSTITASEPYKYWAALPDPVARPGPR